MYSTASSKAITALMFCISIGLILFAAWSSLH